MQLQLVAEFEGSGLLTCIVQHDGAVYVGCEEGEAALYTVGFDTGFEAVADFPDAGANVQSMVSDGGRLWCFGWRPVVPWGWYGTPTEDFRADAVVALGRVGVEHDRRGGRGECAGARRW